MTYAFLIGGNHWDERWVASHPLLSGESVPVSTTRQPGGAVANMARALGSAGVVTQVASVYGDVAPPILGPFQRQIAGETSARYVSLEDAAGRVLHGFADMAIYERAMMAEWYAELIPEAAKADAVVLDCNGPGGVLCHAGWFACTIGLAVSPAKARRLAPVLDRLEILFCNAAEAAQLDLDQVAQAVVTLGGQGARLLNHGKTIATFPAPNWQPRTANGLGDRLAGLTLAGVLAGEPLDRALPEALEALPC